MASYTTPLRALIEQPTQHRNDLTLDQKIEVGRVTLFDFDYPMFDDRYKKVFETNFINNFYDREIGFETEYLFKRRLQNWLRINMGYYSELMRSETLKFDPFINSEMNVKHTKTNDEVSNTDKNFGETTSKDTTDSTVIDEDTFKVTDKDSQTDTTDVTDRDSTTNTTNTTDRDSTTNTNNTTDKDSTIDTTNDTTSNMSGEVNGTSGGTSKTIDSGSEDTTSNTTQETDGFKRDLHTDTPDTRLAITTNDGSGSVGYASDITESKTTENQTTDATGHSETTGQSDTTTSDTTHTDSTQQQTTNELGQSKEATDITETGLSKEETDVTETGLSKEATDVTETGQSIEATDVTETGTRDETIDRIVADLGKRDFDEKTDGTVNTIEDFVQHRYGKIGVQTYSKMLMEYRQTFLRIEREIFDEMNQLFMLVY